MRGLGALPADNGGACRSVDTAYAALRDGADEIVIFWPVFRDMLSHPLTDEWNKTFMDEWRAMGAAGKLAGAPVRGYGGVKVRGDSGVYGEIGCPMPDVAAGRMEGERRWRGGRQCDSMPLTSV